MATSSKHDAVRVEDTPEKEHTVDESRLDRNIHLNGAIQAKIDKDENKFERSFGGGCGGIVAPFAFQSKDAPNYIPEIITAITSQVVAGVLVSSNWMYLLHQNKKAEMGEVVLEETP
ncbi:major facilitator superfamily transporter [Paraphaeosphaeria minitans]|uniref:Major facilitator superfamily transporter n=1 Tax=Paraphaeosphaeria minitans TaxID=565426 RepID=A0A9P6GLF5_9PLEO|nr:major facilitator superfamily transporter [Paraphaeosphaeria minitans]